MNDISPMIELFLARAQLLSAVWYYYALTLQCVEEFVIGCGLDRLSTKRAFARRFHTDRSFVDMFYFHTDETVQSNERIRCSPSVLPVCLLVVSSKYLASPSRVTMSLRRGQALLL